ncbi:unnamed protein product [Amoebophrya sp. A25]|nr:unnamed protein product [Amoebophrya sp. A25]|eukprot:GSA25T00012544001.1
MMPKVLKIAMAALLKSGAGLNLKMQPPTLSHVFQHRASLPTEVSCKDFYHVADQAFVKASSMLHDARAYEENEHVKDLYNAITNLPSLHYELPSFCAASQMKVRVGAMINTDDALKEISGLFSLYGARNASEEEVKKAVLQLLIEAASDTAQGRAAWGKDKGDKLRAVCCTTDTGSGSNTARRASSTAGSSTRSGSQSAPRASSTTAPSTRTSSATAPSNKGQQQEESGCC